MTFVVFDGFFCIYFAHTTRWPLLNTQINPTFNKASQYITLNYAESNVSFQSNVDSIINLKMFLKTGRNRVIQGDQIADRQGQGQGDTRLTLTPSVTTNSNYVIMVSETV
jgi:hypothetical protein